MSIVVNTRVMSNPFTGMQRYIHELLPRISLPMRRQQPPFRMTSVLNQGWEQLVLPGQLGGDLLWSPANTGPLAVRRQVLTIHDMAVLDHPEWYRPEFARYIGWLLRRLAPRVRRVITTSKFSRDRIVALAGVDPRNISVIYSGVNERFHPCSAEEIQDVRTRFGLTEGRYICFLGSFEPRKNLPRLLNAWAAVRPELPRDLKFAVGGSMPNPKAFRKESLPSYKENVVYLGHVDAQWAPALISGAWAFVFPSLYEGFGFPPLEAMACGTPTLTSTAASIPEVVGNAAITVDPYDSNEIARALIRLITDSSLREELRRNGIERARRFSWEQSASLTEAVLQDHA